MNGVYIYTLEAQELHSWVIAIGAITEGTTLIITQVSSG